VVNEISAVQCDGRGASRVKDDLENVPRVATGDKVGNEVEVEGETM
jgi:hypothetical protein